MKVSVKSLIEILLKLTLIFCIVYMLLEIQELRQQSDLQAHLIRVLISDIGIQL